MTESIPMHLSEAERHGAADGSLDADTLREVEAHLSVCEPCAADVARLRLLMTHLRAAPPVSADSPAELDALWPGIRARIETSKVVPIAGAADATPVSAPRRGRWRSIVWTGAGLVAAAAVLLVSLPRFRARPGFEPAASPSAPADSTWTFTNAADSNSAYEAEATALLNELELQRALLPPQTNASIDRELRVIDDAIAEVKEALARDPNNPALRRLLASSYRQKVDLLKQVHGAS